MYTEEQKSELYHILGGVHFVYHIKVFHIIEVYESTLNSMLKGSYVPQIKPTPMYSDETDLYSEIAMVQRIGKLNAIINIVKLESIPLYINTVPDIAQWRLFIGV
jgi:hypothetical protein